MSKKLHCPTCGKALVWDKNNPYRPFCSERCKLIDLGEWASESHRIPGEKVNPEFVDDESNEH
jgi:endogenous inhibitor of DNA gyrase (YacG/DUF329 family)